jgi:hypothetical protein
MAVTEGKNVSCKCYSDAERGYTCKSICAFPQAGGKFQYETRYLSQCSSCLKSTSAGPGVGKNRLYSSRKLWK